MKMTNEELNIILSRGENSRTEFKEARSSLPNDVFQSVVSFLNHEGGTIIFGANDLGEVTGIDPLTVDRIKKDLITSLNNKEIINPPVKFPVYHLTINGNQILCLKIPVSSQVHTYKGIIYSRENDSDISITDDARISEIYFNKRNAFTESEIIQHLRYEDLEPRLLSDPDAFLFHKGSSWAEKGVKLKNARIIKINKLQFDEFQKGSSWAEKGVKLLPKRTLAILKLLIICLVPVKIEEIKQNLIFGSRDKLRELYLNPLRKEGMIEITVRDKPNSPEQRYVLTEKGRSYLGGFEII